MPLLDSQGRERPERTLWVFEHFLVRERKGYGMIDGDYAGQWFIGDHGYCKVGVDAFETREEAIAFGRKSLEAQIVTLQKWLADLK